jgi:hypothetical protein
MVPDSFDEDSGGGLRRLDNFAYQGHAGPDALMQVKRVWKSGAYKKPARR